MTGKQLLDMVILMRKAQKEYSKTNNPKWFIEAKRMEALVDRQIEYYVAAYEKVKPTQLDLFEMQDKNKEEVETKTECPPPPAPVGA